MQEGDTDGRGAGLNTGGRETHINVCVHGKGGVCSLG